MLQCLRGPLLTTVADPVMAEYITIMLINNKTKGVCALNGFFLAADTYDLVQTR